MGIGCNGAPLALYTESINCREIRTAPKVRPDLRLPGIGRGWGCWGEGGGTGSDQGLETFAEAVGPVGDSETEGRLDLGLVEDRVGGTPDGARELVGVAGLDVAGGTGYSLEAGLGGDAGAELGGDAYQ